MLTSGAPLKHYDPQYLKAYRGEQREPTFL